MTQICHKEAFPSSIHVEGKQQNWPELQMRPWSAQQISNSSIIPWIHREAEMEYLRLLIDNHLMLFTSHDIYWIPFLKIRTVAFLMYAKITIRLVIVPNEKVNPKITDEVIQTELGKSGVR